MIMTTPWTPDFCTVCDKQCLAGAVYCSRDCWEADLLAQTARNAAAVHGSDVSGGPSCSNGLSGGAHAQTNTKIQFKTEAVEKCTKESSSISNNNKPTKDRKTGGAKAQFLYESPMLKPSQHEGGSPPLSPLLMPSASKSGNPLSSVEEEAAETTRDHVLPLSQSVSTYRRWLAESSDAVKSL